MPNGAARTCFVLATAVGACLFAPRAHAQGATGSAVAERLFREGRELFEAGETAPACEKFAESQRLDPAIGTLLNLAECEARLGHTATAWVRYRELAERARRDGQSDRVTYAETKVAELEARLTLVELRLAPGVVVDRVAIDGEVLGAASIASPLPIDPGLHRVEVVRGAERYLFALDVPAKPGKMPFDLPLDEAHRARPAAPVGSSDPVPSGAGTGGPSVEVIDPGALREDGVDGRAVAGWILVGVAAVGAGVGTALAVHAMSLKDDADARCDGTVCDPVGLAAYEDGRTVAHGATVSFAVGGAAGVTGASLLIWAAVDGPPAAAISFGGRF